MHLLPRMMQRRGGTLACELARLYQPAVELDRLPL
jgi:hypothetical protein